MNFHQTHYLTLLFKKVTEKEKTLNPRWQNWSPNSNQRFLTERYSGKASSAPFNTSKVNSVGSTPSKVPALTPYLSGAVRG